MPLSEFPVPAADTAGDEPPEMRVAPPGPSSRSALARLEQVECPAFGRRREARAAQSGAEMLPIVLSSGKGSNVFDVDGNRYVDLIAGFGALVLGHGATPVLRALGSQADRLLQALGDVYSADAKIALLERIAVLHHGVRPRVLLGQSGSDAVTAALKTARLATGKPGVIAFEGAYHGLGYGPLAACGVRPSYRLPFADQLNPRVTFAPYARAETDVDRALAAVEQALRGGDVGAVLIEPILGRGGCVVPPPAFLHGVSEAAHRHGALVIADEIWTGMGRSGSMVRSAAVGAPADILCFGKGLGGGLAISACVASEDVMMAWAGDAGGGEGVVHTSTHAGSPLACAAAIATLDALRFRKLPARAREVGDTLRETLRAALLGLPGVVEVRGEGLMIGVELDSGDRALRAVRGMLGQGLPDHHRRHPLGDADLDPSAHHPRRAPGRRGDRAPRGARDALARAKDTPCSPPPQATPSMPACGPSSRPPECAPPSRSTTSRSISPASRPRTSPRSPDSRAPAASISPRPAPLLPSRPSPRTSSASPVSQHTRATATSRSSAPAAPPWARAASTRSAPPRPTSSRRSPGARASSGRTAPRSAPSSSPRPSPCSPTRHWASCSTSSRARWWDRPASMSTSRTTARRSSIWRASPAPPRSRALRAGRPSSSPPRSRWCTCSNRSRARDLRLPAGSRVMQTGGFKGRSREIAPDVLRGLLAEAFGVPPAHVVGEYGMTELSSQLYEGTLAAALHHVEPAARHGVYFAPPWVRVDAVDPISLDALPARRDRRRAHPRSRQRRLGRGRADGGPRARRGRRHRAARPAPRRPAARLLDRRRRDARAPVSGAPGARLARVRARRGGREARRRSRPIRSAGRRARPSSDRAASRWREWSSPSPITWRRALRPNTSTRSSPRPAPPRAAMSCSRPTYALQLFAPSPSPSPSRPPWPSARRVAIRASPRSSSAPSRTTAPSLPRAATSRASRRSHRRRATSSTSTAGTRRCAPSPRRRRRA